jgi:hypothetical protein
VGLKPPYLCNPSGDPAIWLDLMECECFMFKKKNTRTLAELAVERENRCGLEEG